MILEFFNLFCAGILAGIEIAVHYAFHTSIITLDEKPQIVLRQGLIRKLRWLVPAFFVPVLLLGVAVTIVNWEVPRLYFCIAALIAVIVWIIIRIIGTVPVNSATIEWDANTPPKDWREQIEKVEQYHIVGTWAAIATFIFFLANLALSIHP
ncbi:MAG TPA: hypothetical protein VGM63_20635 [Mucilaginibacter sp.]